MNKTVAVLLIAGLVLASCGWRDSRINPRNWFGNSRSTETVATGQTTANPLIPERRGRGLFRRPEQADTREPILKIAELRVEPTSTGALVVATGVAARIGAFNTALRPDDPGLEPDDGVLSFAFVVEYPKDPTPVGSEPLRTVREAYPLSFQELEAVRVIRVTGAQNARESRRR